MTIYNREDSRTVLPQLEKKILQNQQANESTIEQIQDKIANIGDTVEDVPSAVTCGHAKYHKIASITLSAGLWIVNTTAQFTATNTTGYRDIYTTTDNFTDGTTTAPQNYAMRTRSVLPAGNFVEFPNATFPIEIASTTTLNLVGHHNAGSNVNISVTGRMYAVRIK